MRPANYLKVLMLVAVPPAASLAAQKPGDILRVSGNLTAEFIRADSTGLHLSSGFVPYDDITSLELRVGTRSRWREGMIIGAGVGLGAGLVTGLLLCAQEDDPNGYCALAAAGLTVLTATAGGLAGIVVGAGMRTDSFTPILLPNTRAGPLKTPDRRLGLALGVRWRF